jgi:Tfp pilus assembly protein PilW
MFIRSNSKNRSAAAYTLAETVVALGLSCLILTFIITGFIFCSSSLYALSNYANFNKSSENAINQLTREIREMSTLSNYTAVAYANSLFPGYNTITNSLTFVPVGASSTNSWITYSFDPNAQTLTRWQGGVSNVLLSQCLFMNFSMFQRNQTNGTFDPIPTSSPAQTKIVQISWRCQDNNVLSTTQSESLKGAMVVIRAK